ncbi:MAG: TetR/AcrR family transcriptional regulator [Paludibacteraceae bacterium]|nr:TetR/AcrR family transcriptional regulator [Paludibacteraceae bacterium]
MNKDCNTEEKILQAARRVFIAKGLDGARMQEIADEACINKAMVHYYFESKENLFEAVFMDTVGVFFKKVNEILLYEGTNMQEKISLFVDNYMEIIASNPFIPQFMINEINRNPKILYKLLSNSGLKPEAFMQLFKNRVLKNGKDIRQLVISVFALCLFPFIARPLLQIIYFEDNSNEYDQFLSERKEYVKKMLLKFLDE